MFRWKFRFANSVPLLALSILIATTAAFAQWKEHVIYNFQYGTDGTDPVGAMVFDKHGNLYGATTQGGAENCSPLAECGTVFQLSPPIKSGAPWTETVLYVFKGKAFNDGETPAGGLVIDAAGNLYGTTGYGGTGDCILLGLPAGCGTLYELSPPAQPGGTWKEVVLYSFANPLEGYLPWGDLVSDSKGNLYGSSQFGGGYGTNCNPLYTYCGAVFELSPPQQPGGPWTEQVLHGFQGVNKGDLYGDGAAPNGDLVLDKDGVIYGTTQIGGYNCPHNNYEGCGTIFQLTPPQKQGDQWNETVLHRFNPDVEDGRGPWAGLVAGQGGNLYGSTMGGGPGTTVLIPGSSTVFLLEKSSTPVPDAAAVWMKKILHAFTSEKTGFDIEAPLVLDQQGNLYGTTYVGGGSGTVFMLKPSSGTGEWTYTKIYGFGGPPDGAQPAAPLVLDQSGNLFGSTIYGGSGTNCGFQGCGTIFEISPQ